MGCCNSRPTEDGPGIAGRPTSTLETHHQASSTHAIAQSAAPPSTLRNTTLRPQPSMTTTNSTPRASTAAPDLTEQPNAPLRQHPSWTSKKRLWTPSQLKRERYEFFETRVTGNADIWAALRTVTELIREGQLATAQEIVNAAGITVPTGDLVNGAYDSTGQLYKLAPEILRDPENVVHGEGEINSPPHNIKPATLEGKEVDSIESEEDTTLIERRREEKGKTTERDLVKVRCRLSDRGGPDVILSIPRTQTAGTVNSKIADHVGLAQNQRVRIAYLGRILQEHQTLDSAGWKEGHVINGLVSHNPAV